MVARLVGSLSVPAFLVLSLCRPVSFSSGFRNPGNSGMNVYRGVLVTGPPGIGKTTSAHLVARLEGYAVVELNASDARSKSLVQVRRSLFLFYSADVAIERGECQ